MPAAAKRAKRGLAYDIANVADLAAVASGVSWWYDGTVVPNAALTSAEVSSAGMEFVPMLSSGTFDAAAVRAYYAAHPTVQYLLVMNEPNVTSQANLTPAQAARVWPTYEAIASATGVKLVGPAMTWGTMAGYADPAAWLDAFYAAYRAANDNRAPRIDALAFHWHDYGLGKQLDRLRKYGKPFWVTEFANRHSSSDGTQIDTLAKQEAQMTEMVATCESRADVTRYAWSSGRTSPDPHFESVLGAAGTLTPLGRLYLTLPHP